ncbi:plant invertase/pectin methylesterase inhibitor [Striga asiatica]|uniref:Plant invertase/pectin methylesterase inhibitor n=1 Tax=Striga asiatica TaxID=4170 RepID=A0A5A7QT57_STRAF|nr:plant invertase/pectin methylesterase inhibitor [Striga asiatica]
MGRAVCRREFQAILIAEAMAGQDLNADKYEIATLVLQCLEKHADSLAANMSDFANRASHDSGSRKAYKDCKSLFSKATKELESAAKEIKNNDYDSADRFVFRARMCNLQCYGNTEKGKDVGIPIDVKSEMMVFEQLSEAVMRIIERF